MAADRGGAFTRKPNISLRLIADGTPAAKLLVLPAWQPHAKKLNCAALACELLTEEDVVSDGVSGKKWRRRFAANLKPNDFWVNLVSLSAEQDALRVVGTIGSFLNDWRAVLARCATHCCICGRALSDELSRGRGIGPECIKVAPFLLILSESTGFIVPEKPAEVVGATA
jgi:hypothetical protein